ncbi:MAG: 7-cyano-7-deazaguanine synthase [Nitrososphaeraceae archaeon]|nr:7-cyano-7-deazaguanine synthase [Nitrososphaeraceae archaeon]
MIKETKALVLLSGGIDSATCLYWTKKKFSKVFAITFNYYDRIEKEKKAAADLAKRSGIANFLEINVPFIKEYSDFYNGRNCYEAKDDNRLSSYIPARNLIFYSISAHYAEFLDIKWIIGGHNSHDAKFYKDATKDYIQNINSLLKQGRLIRSNEPCTVVLPLAEMDRRKIINLAFQLKVPLELTWSCHLKGESHCRQCYSCLQRIEAFDSLGIKDPVLH